MGTEFNQKTSLPHLTHGRENRPLALSNRTSLIILPQVILIQTDTVLSKVSPISSQSITILIYKALLLLGESLCWIMWFWTTLYYLCSNQNFCSTICWLILKYPVSCYTPVVSFICYPGSFNLCKNITVFSLLTSANLQIQFFCKLYQLFTCFLSLSPCCAPSWGSFTYCHLLVYLVFFFLGIKTRCATFPAFSTHL